MGGSRIALLSAFEHGKLDQLKELSSAEAYAANALDLCAWAHSMSGDLQKALWHYNWLQNQSYILPPVQAATIHFALGVAHTRRSDYATARAHFRCNRKLARIDDGARFFFLQGLGFYRFFTGRHNRSRHFAEAAFEAAAQSKFKFGQLLAEDLLAHALIECGDIRRGMRHLAGALTRARELDHSSLRKSLRLLVLLNEVRFGIRAAPLAQLERAFGKLKPQDTYSLNAVRLELANQYMLRGQVKRAYRLLDEASDSIYTSQNRRQIALLNFRLAFLTYLRGGAEQSLHLLKAAELHLHKDVDRALWLKMKGLRARIHAADGRGSADSQDLDSPAPARVSHGSHAQAQVSHGSRVRAYSSIQKRIEQRQALPAAAPSGQDHLGDLYDGIRRREPPALTTALENQLYYFLYDYFDLRFSQKTVFFDLLPKGALIIDQGDIFVVEHGLTRVLRRILQALGQSHQSKEDLIRNVWGYEYESGRHDPLVYTSISKLRQLLGPAGRWIEMDEKGYRLQSGVWLKTPAQPAAEKPRAALTPVAANSQINLRQLRILAAFGSGKKSAVGVDDVMRDFAVSRATATRDLTELTANGYLNRLGRARATRYVRTGKSEGEI